MIWRSLWILLCTATLLTLIQISVCFRIKPSVSSEENNNEASIIHEKSEPKISNEKNDTATQSPAQTFKGFGRNPAIRKLIENEDPKLYEEFINLKKTSLLDESTDTVKNKPDLIQLTQPESTKPVIETSKTNEKLPVLASISGPPMPNKDTEQKYSVKKSPAEVFKGFGRNPAIRKLVENEDPQLYEKLVNYMKTSQLDIAESESISGNSESANTVKNKADFFQSTQPESTIPVIEASKINEKLPVVASSSGSPKLSAEQKEEPLPTLPQPLNDSPKYLNTANLAHMTQSSGKGEAQSIECDLQHLDINARCFANIMEVSVTSRSALLGRISFQEAQGHIDLKSENNANFHAVYGPKTPSGFMWRLQEGVTVDEVDVGCQTCSTLELRMMVLVMEEFKDKNKRCVVDLTCTQKNMPDPPRLPETSQGSQNDRPQDSVASESVPSKVHAAKTILNILKGTSIDSEVLPRDHVAVGLGTKLGLVISAYTKDVTLDLHILGCDARGEDGKGITLIKDGCSAHQAVKEFHEVLGIVHDPEVDDHHIVKVSQHTTFEVFNFSPKPQAIAIICKIKMCGGECEEQPECVNSEVNLGHRKQKSYTIFYEEVVLGQMLNVAGLPHFRGAPKDPDLLSNIIEPEEETIISLKQGDEHTIGIDLHANCVPKLVFYTCLGILGALFLLLLCLGLYFTNSIVIPRMSSYKNHKLSMDEVESPTRSLYQEYSSPRRRSPGSKTPEQQPILTNIVYR